MIFLSNITVALKNLFLHHQVVETLDDQKKELEFKINILKNYVLKEHSHKRRAKGLVKLFEKYL